MLPLSEPLPIVPKTVKAPNMLDLKLTLSSEKQIVVNSAQWLPTIEKTKPKLKQQFLEKVMT